MSTRGGGRILSLPYPQEPRSPEIGRGCLRITHDRLTVEVTRDHVASSDHFAFRPPDITQDHTSSTRSPEIAPRSLEITRDHHAPQELNDIPTILVRRASASEFAGMLVDISLHLPTSPYTSSAASKSPQARAGNNSGMIVDNFDEMREQSERRVQPLS